MKYFTTELLAPTPGSLAEPASEREARESGITPIPVFVPAANFLQPNQIAELPYAIRYAMSTSGVHRLESIGLEPASHGSDSTGS